MPRVTKYVVISPVRDEEQYIEHTIQSMMRQTIRPIEWVIVNDGSTDRTGQIIDTYARQHLWIRPVHRENRGFRKSGGGVIEAFYDGYERLTQDFDFIVKLDGDLSFHPQYFESCLARFASEPLLGIGGGMICSEHEGQFREESSGDPPFHVRGATKIYRRACWDKIGPLIRAPGWDTIDEVKANMLGWITRTFRDIQLVQHKATGIADGCWRNSFKNGMANYITGYHPVFMAAKCLKRLVHKPYLVDSAALLCGFLSGYVNGVDQVKDKEMIRYLRKQQLNRLLGKKSIWT